MSNAREAAEVRPLSISAFDRQVFAEGHHWHAYRFLGAHRTEQASVHGVRFATWAPQARAVSVVGDFNHWDDTRHALILGCYHIVMRTRGTGRIKSLLLGNVAMQTVHLAQTPVTLVK